MAVDFVSWFFVGEIGHVTAIFCSFFARSYYFSERCDNVLVKLSSEPFFDRLLGLGGAQPPSE